MSDHFYEVIKGIKKNSVVIEEEVKNQIKALDILYSNINVWLKPYELDGLLEVKEEESFDFPSEYKELIIKFDDIHYITVRPHVSYRENTFFVNINYYKYKTSFFPEDLKSDSTNTTKLNYSIEEGWTISPSISFGNKGERFTEEAFKKLIEKKLL